MKTFADAPRPDEVFYDMFSFQTESRFWLEETFVDLLKFFASKRTSLYTYSSSTRIRANLLAAGFFVSSGVSMGPKSSTTVAMNFKPQDTRYTLLDHAWLKRYDVSHVKDARQSHRVRNHPQFSI